MAAVIKADWYDPAMNPKLTDFCRRYGMTPMPFRSYTPQHKGKGKGKGKVERGVAYAKSNALKGWQFASLGEQNAHLLYWEEQVADKRVHGTTRRQVAVMFEEERKGLGPLTASVYESYQEGRRRVQRDSFVEVAKAYYEAPPEFIGRQIWVLWDGRMVRLLNERMEQVDCHVRLESGKFSRCLGVRGLCGRSAKRRLLAFAGRRAGRGCRSLGTAGSRCPLRRGYPQHHGPVWTCRQTSCPRHRRRLRQGHQRRHRTAVPPGDQAHVRGGWRRCGKNPNGAAREGSDHPPATPCLLRFSPAQPGDELRANLRIVDLCGDEYRFQQLALQVAVQGLNSPLPKPFVAPKTPPGINRLQGPENIRQGSPGATVRSAQIMAVINILWQEGGRFAIRAMKEMIVYSIPTAQKL